MPVVLLLLLHLSLTGNQPGRIRSRQLLIGLGHSARGTGSREQQDCGEPFGHIGCTHMVAFTPYLPTYLVPYLRIPSRYYCR